LEDAAFIQFIDVGISFINVEKPPYILVVKDLTHFSVAHLLLQKNTTYGIPNP
jgi:hypothetical protein